MTSFSIGIMSTAGLVMIFISILNMEVSVSPQGRFFFSTWTPVIMPHIFKKCLNSLSAAYMCNVYRIIYWSNVQYFCFLFWFISLNLLIYFLLPFSQKYQLPIASQVGVGHHEALAVVRGHLQHFYISVLLLLTLSMAVFPNCASSTPVQN